MTQKPSELWHVPPTITAIVAELPKAGSQMHRLRKQAFLRALSAAMNFYYHDKNGKQRNDCNLPSL